MYLREGYVIEFLGSRIRQLRPDEASAFGIIRRAIDYLRRRASGKPHSGVYVRKMNLNDLLATLSTSQKFYSESYGRSIINVEFRSFTFITCIDKYLDQEVKEFRSRDFVPITFPKRYSPEQEIVLINYFADLSESL